MAVRGQSKYMTHMRARNVVKPHGGSLMEQHDAMNAKAKTNVQKGKRGGDCNRTQCQRSNAWWYNKTMQAYYCGDCAGAINESCLTRDHLISFPDKIYVNPPIVRLDEFEEACQVVVTTADNVESVYHFANTKEEAEEGFREFCGRADLRGDGTPPFHYSELPEKMERLKKRIEELSVSSEEHSVGRSQ